VAKNIFWLKNKIYLLICCQVLE